MSGLSDYWKAATGLGSSSMVTFPAAVRQESAGAVRVGRWDLATRDACRNNALTVRTQAQSLSKLFLQSGVLKGLDQFFEAGWFHHLEA